MPRNLSCPGPPPSSIRKTRRTVPRLTACCCYRCARYLAITVHASFVFGELCTHYAPVLERSLDPQFVIYFVSITSAAAARRVLLVSRLNCLILYSSAL